MYFLCAICQLVVNHSQINLLMSLKLKLMLMPMQKATKLKLMLMLTLVTMLMTKTLRGGEENGRLSFLRTISLREKLRESRYKIKMVVGRLNKF